MGFEDSVFDPKKDEYLEGGGFVKKEAAELERTAQDIERVTGFSSEEFLETLAGEEDAKRAWDALTGREKLLMLEGLESLPEEITSRQRGYNVKGLFTQGLFKIRGQEDIGSKLTKLMDNNAMINMVLEENPELRDDKELMLGLVISGNSYAPQQASERLRNDKDYALGAVQRNGMALGYLSEAMRDNEDVVMAAVKKRGLALSAASPRLRNNREVVVATITSRTGDGGDFNQITDASDEVIESLLDENNPANKDILQAALHNERSNEIYAERVRMDPQLKGVHQYEEVFKKYEHLHMREKIEKILGEKL